ncbi:pyruvate kinase [bacterium]|nr:pyruvate kinase [bacterium]
MKNARKTKIVATVGNSNVKDIEGFIRAGMNVARLNFSHGSHEEHLGKIKNIRVAESKLKMPVAILQDLSGPKIRIGDFTTEKITLKKGASIILTTEKIVGDEKRVSISYHKLPQEISTGRQILLDDGKRKLIVEKIEGAEIFCKILVGGEIRGHRGVNLPGTKLSISSITEKDKMDLAFGLKNKVDFVALSFVRSADDVRELRKLIGKHPAKIISKIETDQAVEDIDAIIAETDGIMVARGDLAVEIPAEDVPIVQKTIIKKCNEAGKPVIIATQMLESMIGSPVPTRAEVNDVANAILDGADAVMLSGETAVGEYPALSIETMAHIVERTEGSSLYGESVSRYKHIAYGVVDSVSAAVVKTARNIDAKAIIAFSEKGLTARMVSRYKPEQPIIVLTPREDTFRTMLLSFGCTARIINPVKDVREAMAIAEKIILKEKIAKKGERFVIAAGVPFGHAGGTNMFLAHTIR